MDSKTDIYKQVYSVLNTELKMWEEVEMEVITTQYFYDTNDIEKSIFYGTSQGEQPCK